MANASPTAQGRGLLVAALLGIAACAPVNPAKPTDTTLSCAQIADEITELRRSGTASEAKAVELRPGYYALQAVGMVPYVGDALGVVDMVTDMSGDRQLDRLNANTEATRVRGAYLAKMQTARCPPT